MSNVEIKIDTTKIKISKSGAVWGAIWIQRERDCVPQKGWMDLTVGVLESWGASLVLLQRGAEDAEFRFFDGPYGFNCKRVGNKLNVVYWSRGPWVPPTDIDETLLTNFVKSYIVSVQEMVEFISSEARYGRLSTTKVSLSRLKRYVEELKVN